MVPCTLRPALAQTGRAKTRSFDFKRTACSTNAVGRCPFLSALDLVIAPNGNVVVSSEFPLGSTEAKATLREYDSDSGKLVRVFALPTGFRKPRGIRFDPDNRLYCTGADHVARFDFSTGHFLDFLFQLKRLNGQSVEFVLD